MRMLAGLLFSISMMASGAARAEWYAKAEGPDVFGKTKVFASAGAGQREDLVVQCDDEKLLVAFLMRQKPFDLTTTTPAKFLIQIDSGQPTTFAATMRSWNKDYFAVAIADRSPEMVRMLEAIGGAKQKINIGIEILGERSSATFAASGSRKAMNTVLSGCKLSKPSA